MLPQELRNLANAYRVTDKVTQERLTEVKHACQDLLLKRDLITEDGSWVYCFLDSNGVYIIGFKITVIDHGTDDMAFTMEHTFLFSDNTRFVIVD
jgi:hypothetical protein